MTVSSSEGKTVLAESSCTGVNRRVRCRGETAMGGRVARARRTRVKLLRPAFISVVLIALGGCGGQTSGKRNAASSSAGFASPRPQVISSSDTAWVTQDWEATVHAAVKCVFASSTPVVVDGSAATYGVTDPGGLLSNPAELRPGQVLEFACGRTTPPRTGWFLWYTNVGNRAKLIGHAEARGGGAPTSNVGLGAPGQGWTRAPFSIDPAYATGNPAYTAAALQVAFTKDAVAKGYALTLRCEFQNSGDGGSYFVCGPPTEPIDVYVGTGGDVYLKRPNSSASAGSPASSGSSNSAPSASSGSGASACGMFTGPPGQGQVTVQQSPGVSCSTAIVVMKTLFGGGGIHHVGTSQANSYTDVDGWRCFGPQTRSATCSRRGVTINASYTE